MRGRFFVDTVTVLPLTSAIVRFGVATGWRQTKRAPTTCLRSRRSSVGDQGPQAARIVNQDVLV